MLLFNITRNVIQPNRILNNKQHSNIYTNIHLCDNMLKVKKNKEVYNIKC